MAAAFFKRTVQIWDLQSGEPISELDTILDFGGSRLALSPDGRHCVAAAWTKGKHGGVACYDALTGRVIWHRADIRHTQRVRFSSNGDSVFCGLSEGRLQHLSASSGATLDALAGLAGIIDSPYTGHFFWDTRTSLLSVRGANQFRIPRLTFAVLDAVFSPEALCMSEAGVYHPELPGASHSKGPVRCIDLRSGKERWRYEPLNHCLTRLAYRPTDGCFYGVDSGDQTCLVRLGGTDGRCDVICRLTGTTAAFWRHGDALAMSDGSLIHLKDGQVALKLAFPQMEYPDPRPREG